MQMRRRVFAPPLKRNSLNGLGARGLELRAVAVELLSHTIPQETESQNHICVSDLWSTQHGTLRTLFCFIYSAQQTYVLLTTVAFLTDDCEHKVWSIERENERLLHRLEIMHGTENSKLPRADPKKTVKCFSRSAADVKMCVPHLLRPFDVLYKTVQYLLTDVFSTQEVSSLAVYNFLWDRLRAVRQDMTIQALPPEQCVLLLEPMVRFHIYYGYKLCELSPNEYDAVLNKKQLLECLKQLLLCFDMIGELASSDECLANLCNEKLNIMNNSKVLACDRKLIECLYIIVNLGDIHPLLRYIKLPKHYRSKCIGLSYKLSVAHMQGNYVRTCRLAARLPPLALAVFTLLLPQVQRRALEVISHAYHSKQLAYPGDALARCLLFESAEAAIEACAHYGLAARGGNVIFNKSSFSTDARVLQPKKMWFMKEIINPFTIRI